MPCPSSLREAAAAAASFLKFTMLSRRTTSTCTTPTWIITTLLQQDHSIHHAMMTQLPSSATFTSLPRNPAAECTAPMKSTTVHGKTGELQLTASHENLAHRIAGGSAGNSSVDERQPMEYLHHLERQGSAANSASYASLLEECTKTKALAEGKRVHGHIIKAGIKIDSFLGYRLIIFYNRCARLLDAREVFDKMPERDVLAWTAMIGGYAGHGCAENAFELFYRMQQEGVKPNKITFISMLTACANGENLVLGKLIHAHLFDIGMDVDIVAGTALLTMYIKCTKIHDAWRIFEEMEGERDVVSWNVMIAGYAKCGYMNDAFELYQLMQLQGLMPDKITFINLLSGCATLRSLATGKLLHAHIIDNGMESDLVVGTALVSMYGKCNSIENAERIFGKMPKRNVVSWNAMIAGCSEYGYCEEAFKYFHQMQQVGIQPNKVSFISMLKGCVSLENLQLGMQVHAHIVDRGSELDVSVANALLTMYTKCGSIEDARRIFDKMRERDVVSWTTMVSGYSGHGYVEDAFKLFQCIQQEGVKLNKLGIISILNTCTCRDALALGKLVHAHTTNNGLESDVVVGSSLVSMYSRCGSIKDARNVFETMTYRDVVLWNAMIAGYMECGSAEEALKVFKQMQQESVKPNKVTFITIANACASMDALTLGKLVHAHIVDSEFEFDVVVGTALLSMYSKCGSFGKAWLIFNKMPFKSVVSWNAMIAGCAEHGYFEVAFNLLKQMQKEKLKPNKITFISILNVCAGREFLALGKLVHAHITDSGFESDVLIGNALVSMYSKCGSIEDAWTIFNKMPERTVVSWTAMVSGCARHGYYDRAFRIFEQMEQEGVEPDEVTFTSILNACTSSEALLLGKRVHALIVNCAWDIGVIIGIALISMYGRCGSVEIARSVYDKMSEYHVDLCTAMIVAYARHGNGKEALQLFEEMLQKGLKPTKGTCVSILDSCAGLAALIQGKGVHDYIVESSLESDMMIGTALVSMYSRCGSIENAQCVFDNMPKRDVVSWNTMIAGYAQHGHGKAALQLFEQMQIEGLDPDEITLLSILSACSHTGLLDEGCFSFNFMIQELGVIPEVEHYNCIVDLLGRAGKLDEAVDLINNMLFEPDAVTWMSLLSSCRAHGCIERGRSAADYALEVNPELSRAYVMLSNIYAAVGKRDDVKN